MSDKTGPAVPLSLLSARMIGGYSQIVRLHAGDKPIPSYLAGQHIRLVRDLDRSEKYFSIASAPSDTERDRFIELYAAGEAGPDAAGGTEYYFDGASPGQKFILVSVGGDFTLERKAAGYDHVVMIATGTGIAPFRSMIREIAADRRQTPAVTLIHSHHTLAELAYHEEFEQLQALSDFFYLPSITRPDRNESAIAGVSRGRVGSLLRTILELSPGESKSVLSSSYDRKMIAGRIRRSKTIFMACGNRAMLGEVKTIAAECHLPCVGEGWEVG